VVIYYVIEGEHIMNKQVIQIIFLLLICISVFVIYYSEKLVARIKNIKDVNSAGYLLKIIGFLVLTISLYVIYINR
jgi:hypothetical protein